MKREFKAILKSDTLVKSMFEFMKEDTKQNSSIQNQNDVDTKSDEVRILSRGSSQNDDTIVEEVKEDVEVTSDDGQAEDEQSQDSQDNESVDNDRNFARSQNGVVVLQRTRGNVTVDKPKRDKPKKAQTRDNTQMKNIALIESAVYDGQPTVPAKKMTFKEWWAGLGVKISQGWDRFMQKKGAVKFLVILAIMIVMIIAFVIYTAVIRTHFDDIFRSPANAFVYDAGADAGQGSIKKISLDSLTDDKATKKNTYCYQYVEFESKDLDKSISFDYIAFMMYTDNSNLTVLTTMTVFANDGTELYKTVTPKVSSLGENVGRNLKINFIGSIRMEQGVIFRFDFECVKSSDYKNEIKTPHNVDFSIFNLEYAA